MITGVLKTGATFASRLVCIFRCINNSSNEIGLFCVISILDQIFVVVVIIVAMKLG